MAIHVSHRVSAVCRAALLLSAAALWPATGAHAQAADASSRPVRHLMIALDADYAAALNHDLIHAGGGGALRIGSERDLELVALTPELVIDIHTFNAANANDATITSIRGGARIRFLRDLEPGLFVHVGGAHVGGDSRISSTDFAFDCGLSLDYTSLGVVDLGVHGAWNRVFGGYSGGVAYGTLGLHAALQL